MLIAELDDIAIRRIVTRQDVSRHRAGFIGAYQTVFSGFPYFERFYPSEAEGIYRKLTSIEQNICLVATRGETQVIGFAAAIPLVGKPDVATHLSGLVPIKHTFYLAELGVLEQYRGQRVGRTLVKQRLQLVDPQRYSHVVLRVSMNHNPSSEMYRAMGFEDMGVHMDVRSMRTDGKVTTDRRMFMARVLSQVKLDKADAAAPGSP